MMKMMNEWNRIYGSAGTTYEKVWQMKYLLVYHVFLPFCVSAWEISVASVLSLMCATVGGQLCADTLFSVSEATAASLS